MLASKWSNLIKEQTGETVKVHLVGESQILVKVKGLDQVLNVMGFFSEQGKHADVRDEGLLINLEA